MNGNTHEADAGKETADGAGSARILLNDLTATGVGMYSNKPFVSGQEVALALTISTTIYLHGVVLYCKEQEEKTSVITDQPFHYRMAIKFIFGNPAEEAAVAKYCEDTLRALYRAKAA